MAVENRQHWQRVVDRLHQLGSQHLFLVEHVDRMLAAIENIRAIPLPEGATPSLSMGTLLLGPPERCVMVVWFEGLYQIGYDDGEESTEVVLVPEADVAGTVLRYWKGLA